MTAHSAPDRVVTTVRLDSRTRANLAYMSEASRVSMSALVEAAVRDYFDRWSAREEAGLEATLAALRARRAADPRFDDRMAAAFVAAEAEEGGDDPAQGTAFVERD